MNDKLKGLIFVLIGIVILFPQFFNRELIKILIAVYLILTGFFILVGKNGK